MEHKSLTPLICILAVMIWACIINNGDAANCRKQKNCPKKFSTESLKQRLTPLEFDVTQNGKMEKAGTGTYIYYNGGGKLKCKVCNKGLFSSKKKLQSAIDYATYTAAIDGAISVTPIKGKADKEASCTDCGSDVGVQDAEGNFKVNSAAVTLDPEPETLTKKKDKKLKAVKKIKGKPAP